MKPFLQNTLITAICCLFRDSILFPFLRWRLDADSELFHLSLIGSGETLQKTSLYQKLDKTHVMFPPKVW